jgi:hypothetical protein
MLVAGSEFLGKFGHPASVVASGDDALGPHIAMLEGTVEGDGTTITSGQP